MAKIKKGTYRFNDVLTMPSADIICNIDFSVNLNVDGVGAIEAVCSAINVYNSEAYTSPNMQYYVLRTTPDIGLSADGSYSTVYFSEGDEWAPSIGGEALQLITVLEDTDVSDEFGAWFAANATAVVEGKPISGKWTFKDALKPLGAIFTEEVNFTTRVTMSDYGFDDYIVCYAIEYGSGMAYYSTSAEESFGSPKVDVQYGNNVDGSSGYWNDDVFGEGIKTIDFGETPQYVSEEFYSWLIENTERSGIRNLAIMGQLIDKANAVTGKADATLADGVASLCEGYVSEVYDKSFTYNPRVYLKTKIEKPTEEQRAAFIDGSMGFISPDVETICGILEARYDVMEIAEGVSFPMIYLRLPLLVSWGVNSSTIYYIWEEDIELAKLALAAGGLDTSAVIGEGWYSLGDEIVRLSEDDLNQGNIHHVFSFIVPYGSYLDSLIGYRADSDRESADVIQIADGNTLLTRNTVCEKDIVLRQKPRRNVYIRDENGNPIGSSDDYEELLHIDFDYNGMRPYFAEGLSFSDYGGIHQSFGIYGVDGKTSVIVQEQTFGVKIKVESQEKISAIYTNATIASQSDTEAFISGLRHTTYIAVMVENA